MNNADVLSWLSQGHHDDELIPMTQSSISRGKRGMAGASVASYLDNMLKRNQERALERYYYELRERINREIYHGMFSPSDSLRGDEVYE